MEPLYVVLVAVILYLIFLTTLLIWSFFVDKEIKNIFLKTEDLNLVISVSLSVKYDLLTKLKASLQEPTKALPNNIFEFGKVNVTIANKQTFLDDLDAWELTIKEEIKKNHQKIFIEIEAINENLKNYIRVYNTTANYYNQTVKKFVDFNEFARKRYEILANYQFKNFTL